MILFVAEHANGKLSKSAYELAAAARELKRGDVAVLVLGSGVAAVAASAALIADQVLVGDSAELATYDAEVWSAAVAQIAAEGEAEIVLIAGSRSGREYSPRVAVKLDAPLLEDVTSLKDEGGVLHAEHYTFLTRVTERVEAKAPVVVVTVKAGAFAPAEPGTVAAEQFDVDLELPKRRLVVTGSTKEKTGRIALAGRTLWCREDAGLGRRRDLCSWWKVWRISWERRWGLRAQ